MNYRRFLQACALVPFVLFACVPCLLAQEQFPNQFGQPGQEIPPEVIGIYIAFIIGAVVVGLAIAIVIAVLLAGCYSRIPQQYRDMEPGMVYLMLIPCLNIVWVFFVTLRLSTSFQKYFAAHGRTEVGDCGYQLGLWYSICTVASIVPCVNYVAGPAALVLLIIYLVKVMGLKNQIPLGATS
jgi:hypothetical protein